MRFAYPEFLYAFLVLAIPIIIHLFNFRRYKTLYFSSILFLKKLDENTKSIKQIKHWIILFLRLLAFSCLVLAFAQPYIPGKSSAKSGQSTVMSIYLDNSYSMSAMGVNGSLLNQGKETVRKIIEKSPAGTNFQLMTNALTGKESRLVRKTELLDRIDQLDFSPQSKKIRHVLNFAKTSLDEQDQQGARQYLIISDFQKQEDNFKGTETDSLGTYYPFQMVPQRYDNLYIDSVWFESPMRKVNVSNELYVRVINNGETELTNVPLTLTVNDFQREIFIDVPASNSVIEKINYTDRQTGIKSGKVEIADNQLFFDDAFYFSYNLEDFVDVLILNDKDSDESAQLVFETDSFFKVSKMLSNQVQFEEIAKSDIVIVNGLNDLPSALSSELINKVNAGGSVLLIPGEAINLTNYNRFLGQLSLPLMTDSKENNRRMTAVNYDAPFFAGMFEQRKRQLNLPKMTKVYPPQINVKSNFTQLINFEDESPFFLQSGTSNAFVFYGSTNEKFGNLSRHGIYTAVLLRAAAISQTKNDLFNKLDQESTYIVDTENEKNPRVHIVSDQIDYLPQLLSQGANSLLNLDRELLNKLVASNYQVQIDNKNIDVLSLNYGRKESEYAVYSKEDILDEFEREGIDNIQFNTLEDFKDIEQLSLNKPFEYWRILLILGLTFLIMEMILLKIWKF
jgi:hypothetical protein